MNGAYILAGILSIFFLGCFCMVMDILYTNEPKVSRVIVKKPKLPSVLVEDYENIDNVEDWEDLNTESFKNS